MTRHIASRRGCLTAAIFLTAALGACSKQAPAPATTSFDTPESAVQALSDAATKSDLARLVEIFGKEGQDLVDTSDPETARHNRQVFAVAMGESWHLEDQGKTKVLVVGNEGWPFPVPLIQEGGRWRFDTAAGKEEVLARRIGRNELGVIRICRTYVAAQRMYARDGHDGLPAGIYATSFRSSPGKQQGLYWLARAGAPRSPIGELLEEAEDRGSAAAPATPFHGYYFRILGKQGASAPGGPKDYMVNGRMSGGFALVAWPAFYDASGIMTFIVNQDGIVREKDLGPDTAKTVAAVQEYDPDPSWMPVH